MHLGHPPLDFPVFGLDSDWSGPRWVSFFSGQSGAPVWEVLLEHGAPQDERSLMVATLPSKRHALLMAPHHDPLEAIASAALTRLIDRVTPDLPEEQQHALNGLTARLMNEQTEHYREWPKVLWTVDGQPVSARIFEWGGGWTGFTADVVGVAIVVAGRVTSANGLRLVNIGDGKAYHFDSRAPLAYPDALQASRRAALGDSADNDHRQWPLHEDQLGLLALEPDPPKMSAPLVADPETVAELQTYLDHHFACSSYEADGDPEDVGEAHFTCDCGRATGWYPSHDEGEIALDAHLDAVGAALNSYIEQWIARQNPETPIDIQGRGWGLHVHPHDDDSP